MLCRVGFDCLPAGVGRVKQACKENLGQELGTKFVAVVQIVCQINKDPANTTEPIMRLPRKSVAGVFSYTLFSKLGTDFRFQGQD